MIAGFLAPSEGTIAMDVRTISSRGSTLPPEKRNMSMIFQSYAIWPNMTVAENVAFGLEVRRGPKGETADTVQRLPPAVPMSPPRPAPPPGVPGRPAPPAAPPPPHHLPPPPP